MVSIERVSYELGGIIADIIMISVLPSSGFTVYKFATKFANFATAHSVSGFSPDEITENVFQCLPFLD